MGKVVNQVKLVIPGQSEPHFGGRDGKTCKMTKIGHLSQSKPFFWQNSPLWAILCCFSVKQFKKVEKLKKIANVPLPMGMKIFEISPKMRYFGGKRWEKL